ncbi:TrmH family RNA methyltransferase [Corynebacterium kroppenstedtii]|uniref:TrmH family RNA methyltransferase n=1 Tax=Corynebacterium sp. PCR 32 TaxID=3351342 RepID=UPI0030AC4976
MMNSPQDPVDGTAPRDVSTVINDPHHDIPRRIVNILRDHREHPTTILIDDIDNIQQATRSGIHIESLYASEGTPDETITEIHNLAGEAPVHILSRSVIDNLFGKEKRTRIFALAPAPQITRLGDLSTTDGDIIVLDGVRLVGNIGAITRSAVGFGASAVVLLDSGLANAYDRRLIRASRGLVFSLPLVLATPQELLEYVRQEKITVGTFAARATDNLETLSTIPGRMAIILGSERHGVSDTITANADHTYSIPMSPHIDSYNVSVSAAIALYERNRRTTTH